MLGGLSKEDAKRGKEGFPGQPGPRVGLALPFVTELTTSR